MQLLELHESALLAHCCAGQPVSRRPRRRRQAEYQWTPPGRPNPTVQFHFCKRCGICTPGRSELEVLGGAFYAVQVSLLDDLDPDELAAAPIRYVDGRHDRFDRPPDDVRFL